MSVIPSLWRPELAHPSIAHFPIALILTALLIRLASLWKGEKISFLLPASRLVLALGVAGAWAAFLSGGIAEDVVNRLICDPTVTHEHEDWALYTSLLASAALAMDAVEVFSLRFAARFQLGLRVLAVLFLLLSAGGIARTGHLGASLVYQQGAAVYHPSESCQEFE